MSRCHGVRMLTRYLNLNYQSLPVLSHHVKLCGLLIFPSTRTLISSPLKSAQSLIMRRIAM